MDDKILFVSDDQTLAQVFQSLVVNARKRNFDKANSAV
jgi:hypothetical protein